MPASRLGTGTAGLLDGDEPSTVLTLTPSTQTYAWPELEARETTQAAERPVKVQVRLGRGRRGRGRRGGRGLGDALVESEGGTEPVGAAAGPLASRRTPPARSDRPTGARTRRASGPCSSGGSTFTSRSCQTLHAPLSRLPPVAPLSAVDLHGPLGPARRTGAAGGAGEHHGAHRSPFLMGLLDGPVMSTVSSQPNSHFHHEQPPFIHRLHEQLTSADRRDDHKSPARPDIAEADLTQPCQAVTAGFLPRLPGTRKQWFHLARSIKEGTAPHRDRPSPRLLRPSTRARRGRKTENGNRPHGTGGVRRSEGSNVSCPHAAGCPLFPLLRASLQGWRDYYCDSEDQWAGCARYQVSLTGERVPISLLPNGARARHLEDATTDADPYGAAHPEQGPPQAPPPHAPPPQHDPWPPQNAPWSQSAPARPPEPSEHVTAAPEAMAQFGAASPTIPVSPYRPSSAPPFPEPPDHPSRHAGRGRGSKRGWWARFTEWMGGPA